ncbi:MAG TPA: succinate dehydrogenase cytochrome b subunit, partial [Nitriliruptorales bacterium]
MAQAQVTDRGHPGEQSADDRRLPWVLELYRSAVGKKYVMAITGIVWLGYVLAHMIGNLHLYQGAAEMNHYGEWLRELLQPAFPRTWFLWLLRSALIVSLVLHVHAAWSLTVMNRKARPTTYQSKRDYIAADFAARTMRWTGVIVLLFVGYHLADLTWGVQPAAPEAWTRGAPYQNVVSSLERWPVAIFYLLANLALGVHLYHGAWSLFQSLGVNNRRFNHWRRMFAVGF